MVAEEEESEKLAPGFTFGYSLFAGQADGAMGLRPVQQCEGVQLWMTGSNDLQNKVRETSNKGLAASKA